MSSKYVPEIEEPEYSERIKLIQQAHKDVGLEYIPNEKDAETLKEIAYLRLKKKNPATAKEELLSVYRERNDQGEEFMIYKVRYSILDHEDRELQAEVWLGKKPRLDVRDFKDAEENVVNRIPTRWNMEYTQKWDPKHFEKICKDFISVRTALYLSTTSEDFWQNFGGTSIMIRDREKFKTLSYDQLLALDQTEATKAQSLELTRKMNSGRIQ